MQAHGEEELAVPAICAFEVLRGTARAGDDRFDSAVEFLRTLTFLDLALDAAIAADELDERLHADGTPLGARETLVASPARKHGYRLVTRDRDFDAVPRLDVAFYDDR